MAKATGSEVRLDIISRGKNGKEGYIMKNYEILKGFTVLFTLFIVGLTACDSADDEQPVVHPMHISTETPSPTSNIITVRGMVESVESRNVYSTLGFMIDRVYVEAGERVTEGQILGVLDTENLELTIAQQRANLDIAQQNSQNALQDSRRMLNEATTNLSNNTNIHILSAESSLSAAAINLESVQQNYDDAMRDYRAGNNPQILSTESFLRTARIELERIESNHANISGLHLAGIISQEEFRQSENALTLARNQYNDARISYENAKLFQQRSIEQLRTALQSAITAHQNAQAMLSASRVAAQQDIERLRSNVASAERSTNFEHMEIAIQQQERLLEDSVITAPISGTITTVIAREGAVGMGLMFIVEDTDNLRIITRFREYDIGQIKEGMEVVITSNATGADEYTGIISRINPAATSFAPVVEFEAEILVTSVNTGLRIGMNTRVDIDLP